MSDSSLEWIESRIYDKKHFTARYLAHFSDISGMKPETIAKILCVLLFAILTFSDQAHFFANSILIGIPLLLIFYYPEEKPSDESFCIYFPIFGGMTLFDRNLENIPCYYVLKMLLFLFFYMPPYTVYQQISDIIWNNPKVENTNKSQVSKRNTVSKTTNEPSTRTAIPKDSTSKSNISTDVTQLTTALSPLHVPSQPKKSDVKVTIIEEYYREEELLSPNGTLIDRVVTGPFRKETTRTENKKET